MEDHVEDGRGGEDEIARSRSQDTEENGHGLCK